MAKTKKRPKTWREKLNADKAPKRVKLDKAFGGMQVGEWMLVATPKLVAEYIQTIPAGEVRDVPKLRADLAAEHGCKGTCPLSTSIFIRIAAEAELESMQLPTRDQQSIPFWRVVAPESKIAKRLNVDPEWIAQQRDCER